MRFKDFPCIIFKKIKEKERKRKKKKEKERKIFYEKLTYRNWIEVITGVHS